MEGKKNSKKLIAYHPFLFALYPTLFLFSHNRQQLTHSDFLLPSAIIMLFAVISFLFFKKVLKNTLKAGVIVSLFLVLFFFYGNVIQVLSDWLGRDAYKVFFKPRYMLPLWSLSFVVGTFLIIRTPRKLDLLNKTMNLIAAILIAFPLVGLLNYEVTTAFDNKNPNLETMSDVEIDTDLLSDLPDIYYIVLDGYASSKTLREVYDFENDEIETFLESKGFYIAGNSTSNYKSTYVSLSSSLNMKYVNYLSELLGDQSRDVTMLQELIGDNEVVKFLKSKGYTYAHFSSGWGPTNYNKKADINYQKTYLNEFTVLLSRSTMLGPFEFTKPMMRSRILFSFEKLSDTHEAKSPKFVFAHILLPHPPWLFGSNGEIVKDSELEYKGDTWKQRNRYVDHVVFTNRNIKNVVESIISKSETMPIIIFQGDHGPFSTDESDGEIFYKERLRIFNAFYLPNQEEGVIYDSISPVNTFRLVFNAYFDENFEKLEDRTYYTPVGKTYDYKDVTDIVRGEQE